MIVASVEKGSPADKAGIESHDVLLEMSGKKIESYHTFRNDVAMLDPGSKVIFNVLRDGKVREISVTLAERPETTAEGNQYRRQGRQESHSQEAIGIEVQTLTKDLAERFGYALGEGVIVTRVTPGSPAAEAGIQPTDLIQSVNRQNVSTVDEFEKAMRATKSKKVLLLVKRGQYSQFFVVPFEHE